MDSDPLVEDLEGSVLRCLPVIAAVFPGAGITAFNVWQTPLDMWRMFVAEADAWASAKQQQQQSKRGLSRG